MFLPLLSTGGCVLLDGDVTVGATSSGTSCVTATKGYRSSTGLGSFSARQNLLTNFTGLYGLTRAGSCGVQPLHEIVLLCAQITGVNTVQVSVATDTGSVQVGTVWYDLTWNGSTGYDSDDDDTLWSALDNGEAKAVLVRVKG